jgi:eukaryotic-like serine/threonine-protein kinase
MEIAGRYSLDREIGRGGMGSVWLGRDTTLGRVVALKRIGVAPGAGTPDLERVEREARLAARLNHPHVVAVFDLVEDDGQHWLVMEYVEGVNLAELVRDDGALTPDEVALLLRQAVDALAAAHEAGIVHRDVKPSNILVTADGNVKLSDFGIARAEADASLTQTGLVTGSPAYLAPEIASGANATTAADVWSLGATAYHALAGRPPYEIGDNVMGALYRIVHEEPPRLVAAGWLAPLLAHTMVRDPASRWTMRRVRDFLDEGPTLAEVVAGQEVTAVAPVATAPVPAYDAPHATQVLAPTPPPAEPVPAASPRRRRGPGGAIIGTLIALLAVLLFLLFAYLFGAFDQTDNSTPPSKAASTPSGPSPTHTNEQSPSSETADPQAKSAAMEAFVTNYLATAVSEPATSWTMLTPEFQAASGNFGQYQKFWNQWQSADVLNISADPAENTVSYTVKYTRTGNQGEGGNDQGQGGDVSSTVTDNVTLRLQPNGDSFLIADEL